MEKIFGTFLKQKRQEKNLTQKQLAKILFVSESTISKWEKDIAHPDITLLPKLSKVLEVTEHELITASIDEETRQEKVQAKKWKTLSFSWNLFFYISYAITILVCFICNLAVNGSLSWFWIVLSSLLLSFSFTNLPKLIKKHKLIFIPLSMFISLCLLLGVCCIYTNGNWFLIPSLSVLFGLIIIFTPIYISSYKCFSKIKKYNDFISLAIDFIFLNFLLYIINNHCLTNKITTSFWYLNLALPITMGCYLVLNIFLSVRFFKLNKLLKSSIILFLFNLFYIITPFIKVQNPNIQKEIEGLNIFKTDFSNWSSEIQLERNIHCIIFLSVITIAIVLFVFGIIKQIKNKTTKK